MDPRPQTEGDEQEETAEAAQPRRVLSGADGPSLPARIKAAALGWLPASTRNVVWENVKTIAFALAIALVVRTFLFQPFNIPSGSMKSTLLVGDFLFVSKYSYGYSRYSFPWGLAPFNGRIFASDPERGDVVVFKNPQDGRDFIKRVIGIPGDRIQMIRGVLHINGAPVKLELVDEYVGRDEYGRTERLLRYRETLPSGVSYLTLRRCPVAGDRGERAPARSAYFGADACLSRENDTRQYVVKDGHFFMMGDNRDHSLDSRDFVNGVGLVPRENLVGKAQVLFLSTNSSFWAVWDWRWGRFFKSVN